MPSATWNLADLFEAVVDAAGDRCAVVVPNAPDGRREYSGREHEARVNQLAHALIERGVKPADKVAIYGYNSNEWLEAMWAAFKIRAVPINVNYRYMEGELRYLFDNADAVAVVCGAEFLDRIEAIRADLPQLTTVIAYDDGSGVSTTTGGAEDYEAVLAASSPERDFAPRSDDDLYILYTGGTTGMPKGVMWRHEDFFRSTIGPMITMGTVFEAPDEVAEKAAASGPLVGLPLAPLMHGNSQWAAMLNALGGRTTVVSAARKMDPAEVWSIVASERVQLVNIVGDAHARPLIEGFEGVRDGVDISSLFVIASGGAILSPAVKQAFAEIVPNVMLVDGLGASETGYQGVAAGADDRGRPRFTFGEHTIVLDDDGVPTSPGSGVIGRLARRGFIPLGYYKDEEKTAATFPTINGERWVIPGDMAVAEADGTITLLGRGSVSINSGGEKIFPEEVELVLKGHPAVYDAVVVGVPDERWGERVVAVVAPRGDERPTADELAAFAKQTIASYKVPREVTYVDALVRSPSGKADYRWAKSVATAQADTAKADRAQ